MIRPHEHPPAPGPAADRAAALRAAIPALVTDRLRLRAPELGDFPALHDICASPRGAAGFGATGDRTDSYVELTLMTANWLLRGHGWWTVTDRATGDILGFSGIGFEPGDQEPELGVLLTEAAEGQGLAAEACRAVRAFARDQLGLDTVVSYVAPANTRSSTLMEHLGARRDPRAEAALDLDAPIHVFRHDLTRPSAPRPR